MSDCFNHGLDAFESGFYNDEPSVSYKDSGTAFCAKILKETDKAYLLEHVPDPMNNWNEQEFVENGLHYWMPKSITYFCNLTNKFQCSSSTIRMKNMARAMKEMEHPNDPRLKNLTRIM